jgi:hypothetical protein
MTKTLLTALGLLALTGTAQAADFSYQAADCTVSMMTGDGSWQRIDNTCYLGRRGTINGREDGPCRHSHSARSQRLWTGPALHG